MSRTRHSFGGSSSFRGSTYIDDDSDPRSGLMNLADLMLVFACGLMVALVAHWNVDITVNQVEISDETIEIQDIKDLSEEGAGNSYIDMGRVYEDKETGKMYIIAPEDEMAAAIAMGQDTAGDGSAGATAEGEGEAEASEQAAGE